MIWGECYQLNYLACRDIPGTEPCIYSGITVTVHSTNTFKQDETTLYQSIKASLIMQPPLMTQLKSVLPAVDLSWKALF